MGGGQNFICGEFVPVPDCAGEEGVASVVCAAAETLVLDAVLVSSSTCRLEFEVRAPHTRGLTSGDLVQHGDRGVWSGVCADGLTISDVGACLLIVVHLCFHTAPEL